MKILAFNIWADFGHFKKYYTTSTPLTFSIPPKTAIFGIIGAILGYDKDEYLRFINGENTKVGIKILKPIRKTRFTFNYIDTKNSNSFHLIKVRTQIKTEFLKGPAYRLYINHSNEKIFNLQ
jgi:CRISPR-associated protein Cas5h